MENENIEATEEVAVVEKVVTPAQEKKFTQADLDKVVRDRLKRENESFKTTQTNFEAEIESLKSHIGSYEEEFSKLIAPKLDAIPEEFKELVEKLPLLEKIAFINKLETKKVDTTNKLRLPKTPTENPNVFSGNKQPAIRRIL